MQYNKISSDKALDWKYRQINRVYIREVTRLKLIEFHRKKNHGGIMKNWKHDELRGCFILPTLWDLKTEYPLEFHCNF